MIKPVMYANDNGEGKYTGLVPLSPLEYENTLKGMQGRKEDPTDFESRVLWLFTNPNPPVEKMDNNSPQVS